MRRLTILLLGLLLPLAAAAQSIPIKTVPVADGDQFLLFPSRNLAMGGVSIALEDPLLDPFVNPALGIDVEGLRFTGTPVYYSFLGDADAGSGRTLPVGMLLRRGDLFGGATFAWQELVVPQNPGGGWWTRPVVEGDGLSQTNVYGFAMGGLRVPGSRLSVGASALRAGLDGIEGVRLLYASGNAVRQEGEMGSYRVGLYLPMDDGRSAELVVLHHRLDMVHTMNRWDPDAQDWRPRHELDETNGWAVRLGYRHALEDGWRVGARLTGDWKWHPKIPNYDLMQIPRDPGNSSAYNLGVGFARRWGQATFGLDLVYEPIWSHTWADALTDTETAAGRTLKAGEMTVENFFEFKNAALRMGLAREADRFDFLLGLDLHRISYELDQENFVEGFERQLHESWTEWTASAGLGTRFPEFEVRYLGRLTLGTGHPGVRSPITFAERAFVDTAADFLVAPSGPLTLQETKVLTHQVSILLPFE